MDAGPTSSAEPHDVPALQVRGLVKNYGHVKAVAGVDLQVQKGEIFAFLGPNGAGKSTTIRCILDLLRPTAGTIEVFGMDPRRDGVSVRSRVAYVPGELRLPERQTASQLVASIGRLRDGVNMRRRDDLAGRLDLDLSRKLRDLSSGNRRKVALLLAFVSGADMLILDEPTSGLDPIMQHRFLEMLRELRVGGTTVFLSSHVLSEVQRVADRVAILRAGKIVAEGTVDELRGRARQHVELWFSQDPPVEELKALPGMSDLVVEGRHVSAVLSGSINPLVAVLARHQVDTMLIQEPDLEEAFLDLFSERST